MVNKKRDLNGYKKQLGKYKLKRVDILTIEKLLRVYSDSKEMQSEGISKLPDGKKHMPRKYVDRHIEIGRYKPFTIDIERNYFGWSRAGVRLLHQEDSVKFLPKRIRKSSYIKILSWPGIQVEFTPLSTTIYAQTHYATGLELKVMKEVISNLEQYLSTLPSSHINRCTF
jgi:hypothetical protein